MADFADAFFQGRQLGQQTRLNRLASEAYTAAPDQQQSLLSDIARIDAGAAQNVQQQFQQQEDRTGAQLRGFVNYVNNARKTGNPAAVNAALQQGAGLIQRITGKPAPTEWTPDMDAGWAQLEARVAMTPGAAGVGNVVHSQRVGDDGFIYNTMRDGSLVNTGVKADRQAWFRDHPGMAPEIVGKDGSVSPVGGGSTAPAMGSAQAPVANGDQFVEESLALANQMIAAGIPEQQVDAFLQSRMNQGGNQLQTTQAVVPMARARPSEADVAAQTEAARQQVDLQYAPVRGQIEAQTAGMREAATQAAKAAGERDVAVAERSRDANDSIDLLNRAESLLPVATGSGVGSLADRGFALIGESTPGSRATASLKTIAGQLVSKMPRMEGPQSDRDVQMYKDMAGNLADDTRPVSERLEALRTIRALQGRYSTQPASSGPMRIRSADDYNSLPSGATFIDPNGVMRRKR